MNPFKFASITDPDSTRAEEAFLRGLVTLPDYETLLEAFPNHAAPGKHLYDAVQAAQRNVSKLAAVVRRICPIGLRKFLAEADKIIRCARENCTPQLIECLIRAGVESAGLQEAMHSGTYADCMASAATVRLTEELASSAEDQLAMIGKAKGGATHSGDSLGDELAEEHEAFVQALEKEFKISAHHWEPVRDGLVVFFDQDAVATLTARLSYNDVLQRITDKLGYLMVQRGAPDDIGGFTEPMSKWMFIRCPHELADPCDPKASAKIGKDREKAAQKLLREIERVMD